MRGWAFGLLGLSRKDFYEMTQGEFWEAMRAYREEKTADRRHLGELARGLGVRIINLFVKKPIRDIEGFWPMPWDEKSTAEGIAADLNAMPHAKREELAKQFKEKTDKYFKDIGDGIGHNNSEP